MGVNAASKQKALLANFASILKEPANSAIMKFTRTIMIVAIAQWRIGFRFTVKVL